MSFSCYGCGNCHVCKSFLERVSDDSLTFAEALVLDPSEVEVMFDVSAPNLWENFGLARGNWTLDSFLRPTTKFRRSRPKRSRVEEMAAAGAPNACMACRSVLNLEAAYTVAIRAVCEWLHDDGNYNDAKKIEREFLDPK